jgi:glycosyltransferase involved in cell wall biosynthesis
LAGQRSTANGQQISFTPWINDLPSFYHSLDCFVLPSREHDPFGLVAGEAMLMGIPTIVTDACGISGYLQNKRDALIVPAGSAQSLRDAITAFMSDPSKRSTMGAAGKHRAIEQFSMERMIQRYEDLLRA